MAIIKYDVSDVESGGGGNQPEPGLYAGKIVSITPRKKNAKDVVISDLEVVVDVGEEFSRLWYYVRLPDDPNYSQDKNGWKLREFTDALGLPPKGGIDPKKEVGKLVKVKVVADTDQDSNYKGKIKNMFLPGDDDATPAKSAASSGSDTGGGEGEGPYGREEIATWSDEDLKGYADELGIDVPTGRGAKAKLIDALVAAEEGGEAEAAAEDAPAESGGSNLTEGIDDEFLNELKPDEAEYADWTDEDVQWLVTGLGMDGNVKTSGRGWKPKAIAAIVEFAQQVAGGNGDAEPEAAAAAVADTYDDEEEWPLKDLKAEIEERNEQNAAIEISGRWTREKMIAALREDNKNAEPF